MNSFDVTIIGSGPGGYVAAIRCAQLGLKTAIIEKYDTLGGTCLNVGCIPSKALLDSSEHFHNAKHNFEEHGIQISNLKADIKQMVARKQGVVDQTCNGVKFLMDKNNITVFYGIGSFVSKNQVEVLKSDGSKEILESKNIIIATGSKPNFFPGMEPDKKDACDWRWRNWS
jgi:dihydrolipoamide dehydrogenase